MSRDNARRLLHDSHTDPSRSDGKHLWVVDLDDVIVDLDWRRQQLAAYIDAHLTELDPGEYARLASLEGQFASRIGRLLRDKQQVQGDEMSELDQAINQALDRISEEWNIEL
jgi:acetyl-CoA carboxylase alpha subunit